MTYPDTSKHEDTTYDDAGNLKTYRNRNNNIQTFTYDNRNRQTGFSWNDGGNTPSQSMAYDDASRVIQIANSISTINEVYFDDNLLKSEEEWTSALSDNIHRTVGYSYDADGNRATIQYPSGTAFNYTYTNRNQVASIRPGLSGGTAVASYVYDASGNITSCTRDNGTSTSYTVDNVNRETAIQHNLVGGAKQFDYVYNAVNDILAMRRDANNADADGLEYDLTQQTTKFHQRGTVNMSTGAVTSPAVDNNMAFDGCGNRTTLNGTSQSFDTMNELTGTGITYDGNGNLSTWNGWSYIYDAQNRLTAARSGTLSGTFYYDGKNRQVGCFTNSLYQANVWDDWELIEEYSPGSSTVRIGAYLQGAHGPIKSLLNNVYYYQDSLGSTSHIANASGQLLEKYRYDSYGKPTFYNASGTQLSASAYSVRDLFSGERYYTDLALYDLRNRFMSPDLGRFLQPDPIGFKGDASNLYRYCGNDWANRIDPMGTSDVSREAQKQIDQTAGAAETIEFWEMLNNISALNLGQLQKMAQMPLTGWASLRDKVGIETTKNAADKMNKTGIPYSQVVLINSKGDRIYSDLVPGVKNARRGYDEVIPLESKYFEAFRSGAQTWDPRQWRVFAIGHVHPFEKSADPRMSPVDRTTSRTKDAPIYKNNMKSSFVFDKYFHGRETRLLENGKDIGPDPNW
jgi:RHS repeat-associated protein